VAQRFVIDGVCHPYNWTRENQRGRYGRVFTDVTFSFYPVTDKTDAPLSREEWEHDWQVDEFIQTMLLESDTDVLCVHSLPIYDAFHDGLASIEKGAELKQRWPDRIIWYAAVDVLQGEKALDAMEYQVKELGADGIKLYPAQYYRGRTRGWRMDDYVLAFPVFEFAQELGVKNVAIHKALPLGPVDDNPYNVDDIGGAAQAFPDLNFQIVHGGLMFVERTQMLLANHPNVYATLEATTLVAVFDPPRFAHAMDAFLQVAPDKVIYSSAGMVSHPSYVLAALDEYEGNLVPVTEEMRNDIMGGTLARLHGIDVEERRRKIADDEFSREKREKGLREPYSTLRGKVAVV